MKPRDSVETFILKANKKHNNKYDYSKVTEHFEERPHADDKIEIVCPIHGSFWQTPYNHLEGRGCPYCGGTKPLTTETFIERLREKCGDRYDYSKVVYKNMYTDIELICPIHGSFWIKPRYSYHWRCPICEPFLDKKKSTTEKFILKAKKVHGDKYDYSKVNYINVKTKVEIICLIHGSFWQTPNSHLKGYGCLLCGNPKKGRFKKNKKNN